MFLFQHPKTPPISCAAVAQRLSVMLYSRRFFPYYAFNILAGLDNEGESVTVGVTNVRSSLVLPVTYYTHTHTSGRGCVYSFDVVGSYDRETYRAGGSASSMLQPLLDNQARRQNTLRGSHLGKIRRKTGRIY